MQGKSNQARQANESTEQRFTRRIGSTTYRVAVHFSKTSTENMSDKIVRLIKNEAESGKAAGQ